LDGLPSLFIAGAPKSGTSSVFRWLADHPEALGSTPKETCFFADPGSHAFLPDFNVLHGLGRYRTAFPDGPPQARLIFEGTASYIYSLTALERIPDLPTRPKCLFILREPSAQIVSTYTYFRNNWSAIPWDMTFGDYLQALEQRSHPFDGNELVRDALDNARYAPWLLKWQERLGPDRMKVATLDTLRQDPKAFMADLARWTGIDPTFYDAYSLKAENESYLPVNRSLQRLNIALRDSLPKGRVYAMVRRLYRRLNTRVPARVEHDAAMAHLRARFADDNRQLEQAFGLDLSAWSS